MKTRGRVRWFSEAKGYGFILPDSGTDLVFVHFQAIQHDPKTLTEGDIVEFDPAPNQKGPVASNVVRVGVIAADDAGMSA